MVHETLGGIIRVVVLSGGVVAAVEFTWYPSDADYAFARQAVDAKLLIRVRSLKCRDRPRLKQSTVESFLFWDTWT